MRHKTDLTGHLPMNLQFFAEPDDNTDGAGDTRNVSGADGGKEGDAQETGKKSFDDFLKDPANQSEFDKRVAKALETQKGKMQQDIQAQIDNARTEAEKLAKMTAQQKAQYESDKREKDLAAREAEITKRELSAQAKETLADKGLPVQLADILNYESAETCQASIAAVEKAFRDAVGKAVDDKLKGKDPMKKAPEGTSFTKEQIAKMTPEEINKNWDAVQASMKTSQ